MQSTVHPCTNNCTAYTASAQPRELSIEIIRNGKKTKKQCCEKFRKKKGKQCGKCPLRMAIAEGGLQRGAVCN